MRSSTGIKQLSVLLLGGLFTILSTVALSESAVTKGSKAEGMDACVAPTDQMRRNHMDYLQHDRDLTVHQGDRTVTNSLSECVNCHAGKDDSGQAVPVNEPGQFCAGCHEYVGVSLSCFQCHRKIPEEQRSSAVKLQSGSKLGLLMDAGQQPKLTPAELSHLHARMMED